ELTNPRRWLWAAQGLVTLAVVAFVARSIARNWTEFRSLHVALSVTPAWIAASALTVLATYAMQIESWRRILAGWHQRLPFAAAAAPHSAPPLRLAAAALVAVATIGALAWRPTAAWLGRLVKATPPLEPLALGAVLAATLLTVLSWWTYGAALWMLARGLIPAASLPLTSAVAAFTLGYVLGLLALFAPGGVGVRELVLIGLLAPFLGSGGAVAVSVASRVLLTVLEGAAALLTFPLRHRPQESVP